MLERIFPLYIEYRLKIPTNTPNPIKLRGVKVGVTMIRYSPNERIKSIINVIMLRKNAKNLFIFAFKIDFATNIKANPNTKCKYTLLPPPYRYI